MMTNQPHADWPPPRPEDDRSIYGLINRVVDPLFDNPLLLVLLLALAFAMVFFGTAAGLVGDSLHLPYGLPVAPRGIEWVIIPLAAIVSSRWRLAADWLLSLRESHLGPYLSLLMAASLAALIAFQVWSWNTPWNTVGPDQFGVVRWLGTTLAGAFTIFWLPLFPRVTATLAGMIAAPTLFGLVGYTFFESHMRVSQGSDGPAMGAFFLALLGMPLWIVGATWLSQLKRSDPTSPQGAHMLGHAVWSGLVMLGLAFAGINL